MVPVVVANVIRLLRVLILLLAIASVQCGNVVIIVIIMIIIVMLHAEAIIPWKGIILISQLQIIVVVVVDTEEITIYIKLGAMITQVCCQQHQVLAIAHHVFGGAVFWYINKHTVE